MTDDGLAHDCVACRRLIEKYQTCEAMHEAKPELCRCKLTKKKTTRNEQSLLDVEIDQGLRRYRYWKKRRQGRL